MVKSIQKIIDFLLFSNIYIGICVAALHFAVACKPIEALSQLTYLLFTFFATVSVYSLFRLRLSPESHLPSLRNLSWSVRHFAVARWVMYIAMIGAVSTFLLLDSTQKYRVILLATLCVLYNISFFSLGSIRFDLRHIWFLKPFIVGFTITGVVCWVPYDDTCSYSLSAFLSTAAIQFSFVSALVVLFEIKDCDIDTHLHVTTIATRLGIAYTKIVALVLILAAIVLFIISHASICGWLLLGYLAPLLLLLIFIPLFIHSHSSEYIYWLAIDGCMIMLGLDWYLLKDYSLQS